MRRRAARPAGRSRRGPRCTWSSRPAPIDEPAAIDAPPPPCPASPNEAAKARAEEAHLAAQRRVVDAVDLGRAERADRLHEPRDAPALGEGAARAGRVRGRVLEVVGVERAARQRASGATSSALRSAARAAAHARDARSDDERAQSTTLRRARARRAREPAARRGAARRGARARGRFRARSRARARGGEARRSGRRPRSTRRRRRRRRRPRRRRPPRPRGRRTR